MEKSDSWEYSPNQRGCLFAFRFGVCATEVHAADTSIVGIQRRSPRRTYALISKKREMSCCFSNPHGQEWANQSAHPDMFC
jgi:hypothetical protein